MMRKFVRLQLNFPDRRERHLVLRKISGWHENDPAYMFFCEARNPNDAERIALAMDKLEAESGFTLDEDPNWKTEK